MIVTTMQRGDAEGFNGIEPGWVVGLTFTEPELAGLLASYDPTSGTSPGVADARPVLRAILNAALAVAPEPA
jgi:hypothetical protein